MITAILILLAAIFKALSDVLAWKQSYFVKKFPKLKSDFWKINEVHRKVHYIAKYPIDAWHISNSLMIASFILAAIFYQQKTTWYFELGIYGFGFTMVFNIFYNKIFQ